MTRLIPLQDVIAINDTDAAILITNNQTIDPSKDNIIAQGVSVEQAYSIYSEVQDQPLEKGFRMFILKEKN